MAASDPTEVPEGVPEDAVDELYGLPIDEFTERRDGLSHELRSGGQRDAAGWVKGLRKPSAAAWVVNQLTRAREREATELLEAADALRAAQERLLAGKGDAAALRSASEAEHAAAQKLVATSSGFLDRDGNPPSAATLEKVAQTIRAVALDDEARAGFAQGRLTRERAASGFGPAGPAVAPSRARKRDKSRLKKAREAQRERAQALKAAERELASAEGEAERAARRLEGARMKVDEARSRLAEAESRVADAEAS